MTSLNSSDYVTVIMNTYQENPSFLFRAINSYLIQKDVKVQIIVSTVAGDPSISLIKKKFKPGLVEMCISTKKEHPGKGIKGIYYQLNKATALIKGDWFCYASSNDVALPEKLKKEVYFCKKNKKAVCYSDYTVTDSHLRKIKTIAFPVFDYKKLLKGNYINDCALINTNVLKQFLPFDNTYSNCGFWNLWLRIYVKLGNVFVHNPNPGFLYRQEPNSTHLIRKNNRAKQARYRADKIRMVQAHLKKHPLKTTK